MSSEAYTRILTSIWSDNAFTALSRDAQWLYLAILTAPDRSLCGVADWRVNRLKARSATTTAADLEIIAEELEATYFLVIDRDTEEALVRSFVRKDTVMKMPNMATAMVKAFQQVVSPRLRAVIVHELRRLHREHPELKGWNEAALDLLNREALDVRDEHPRLAIAG
jgi:hypothetical protein